MEQLANIQKQISEIKETLAKISAEGVPLLAEELKKIMEETPDLQFLSWHQYTPFITDKDEDRVFALRSHYDEIILNGYKLQNHRDEELNSILKNFKSVAQRIHSLLAKCDSSILSLLGEGQVTATRVGNTMEISQDFIDHE